MKKLFGTNIEFLILVQDYYKCLDKRDKNLEISIPVLIALILTWLNFYDCDTSSFNIIIEHGINLLTILIGFSITILTILITSGGRGLKLLKETSSGKKLSNVEISLFKLLLINFAYSIVIEAILILFSLAIPFIIVQNWFVNSVFIVLYSIITGGILHVLLLTIRNMTNLYFCLISEKEDIKKPTE